MYIDGHLGHHGDAVGHGLLQPRSLLARGLQPVLAARDDERRGLRSKQRDPNPKDNSLIRKETSTYKGFHHTSAALFSY